MSRVKSSIRAAFGDQYGSRIQVHTTLIVHTHKLYIYFAATHTQGQCIFIWTKQKYIPSILFIRRLNWTPPLMLCVCDISCHVSFSTGNLSLFNKYKKKRANGINDKRTKKKIIIATRKRERYLTQKKVTRTTQRRHMCCLQRTAFLSVMCICCSLLYLSQTCLLTHVYIPPFFFSNGSVSFFLFYFSLCCFFYFKIIYRFRSII